jgi:hypothetical protein
MLINYFLFETKMKNLGLSRIVMNLVNKRFPVTDRKLELQEALDLLNSVEEDTLGSISYKMEVMSVKMRGIPIRSIGDIVKRVFKENDDDFYLSVRHEGYGGRTEKHYLDFVKGFIGARPGERDPIIRASIHFVAKQKLLPNEGYFEDR